MKISETTQGTIQFPDGTFVRWDFVERIPYEPSAYQNDEGVIVFVRSHPSNPDAGNEYYISTTDASVWRLDEDAVTERVEGAYCPEIKRDIDNFIAIMGS